MKIRLKKFLNKHKNRIFSFIVAFSFMPLFSISSFAAVVSPDAKNEWFLLPFDKMLVGNGEVVGSFSSSSGTYNGVVNGGTSNDWWRFVCSDIGGVFPTFEPENKYLIYYTVSAETGVNCGFDALRYREDMANSSGFNVMTNLSNFSTFVSDTVTLSGFCQYYFYDLNLSTGSAFYIDITTPCVVNGRVSWAFYALDVTNNTQEQINSIVSAINNQTSSLGGKIDDTNDFIDKGNSNTSGIVSGNNSAIDNLDEVVSEYHATEQQFFDDFNTNQQAINSDIVGWSWGGLVNCANWVGSTMTDYYNNMGDFRQYIIYPLMLGIVLFFLGRGGSIIGHLFRKPTETTVNTKSVFRREGNTRYTTTTTSRQGGVWRK